MILARRVELWEWISCARHSQSFVRRDDIFFFLLLLFSSVARRIPHKGGTVYDQTDELKFVLFGLGAPST